MSLKSRINIVSEDFSFFVLLTYITKKDNRGFDYNFYYLNCIILLKRYS